MSENTRGSAITLFITLTFIWGTSFILIMLGLRSFPPDQVGALRVVSAAVFLLPIAIGKLKEIQSHHYWKLFVTGMIGIFIPAFLFAIAETQLSSSVTGIMNTLTPIFTVLISAILFKQRFKSIAIVGIVLGFAGTVLLSLSQANGEVTGFNSFALLIVAATFCYASNVNFVKFNIPDLNAVTITSVSVMLIGVPAAIYLFGFTDFVPRLTTQDGAWASFGFVVILGCMSTAVATVLFNKLVKMSTPLFASSVTYTLPIVAVMWGLIYGETLEVGHYIGMVAIIGGVYLANRK
ncbi:DMT family transporter [Pseudochryseolinea flava]|uniref:EamA family transporter n=1 Tax=Pseudochryseolinea flava TaxID=2059302 RepID=A0A364Y914_9BACT|nr:EamA family transporter [Pseudochryseolinea flava]RAW03467.1 EamA family transporter [Pseudochryseolinea flava]